MENEVKKGERGELAQLTDHMAELGRMFEKANHQIVDYLLQRDSQATARPEAASPSADTSDLTKQIAGLAEKIDALGRAVPSVDSSQAATNAGASTEQLNELLRPIREKLDVLDQQNGALYSTMEQLRTHVDGGVQSLAELLVPQQQEEEPSSISGDWLTAILGPELTSDGALRVPCQQLLEGVLESNGPRKALPVSCSCSAPPHQSDFPSCSRIWAKPIIAGSPRQLPETTCLKKLLSLTCDAPARMPGSTIPSNWSIPVNDSTPDVTTPHREESRSSRSSAGSCFGTTAKFIPRQRLRSGRSVRGMLQSTEVESRNVGILEKWNTGM